MTCKECCYMYPEAGMNDGRPFCHWTVRCPGDQAPCEYEDDPEEDCRYEDFDEYDSEVEE